MIRFIQVTKTPYLENISFNIKRNEIVIIHNSNHTLLRLLLDLIRGKKEPDSGIIRLLNNYQSGEKILAHEIGIVFKESLLLDNRNLIDNFKFIIDIMGLNRIYFNARIKKILKLVNLQTCKNLTPDRLSLHRQKRADIACALLVYPSILILNNPFMGLDEINSRAIYHLLEEINCLGITILILNSEQNFLVNKKRQKRIIYLNKGEITNYNI